ncbi:unnamed protein product, partial [Phaeothamnion confervicola]
MSSSTTTISTFRRIALAPFFVTRCLSATLLVVLAAPSSLLQTRRSPSTTPSTPPKPIVKTVTVTLRRPFETHSQTRASRTPSRLESSSLAPSICFVGLPFESHVEPLLYLAAELAARGYRASLAVPEGPFSRWATAWAAARNLPGLSILPLVPPPPAAPPKPDPAAAAAAAAAASPGQNSEATTSAASASNAAGVEGNGGVYGGNGGGWRDWWGLGWLAGMVPELLGWGPYAAARREMAAFLAAEREMFVPLVAAWRKDRPILVVADRYALAAFDACEALDLPYVINNAGPLLDIDGTAASAATAAAAAAAGPLAAAAPPTLVPAPLSGPASHAGRSLWDRLRGRHLRLLRALAAREAACAVDAFRMSQGLPPVLAKPVAAAATAAAAGTA